MDKLHRTCAAFFSDIIISAGKCHRSYPYDLPAVPGHKMQLTHSLHVRHLLHSQVCLLHADDDTLREGRIRKRRRVSEIKTALAVSTHRPIQQTEGAADDGWMDSC